eukprot:TRINITY_DN3733_c0_g1_i1.p1 TRINITY_DN3733_c0_g1~~TRINITY_DN3733_c0_g1_i1.p1  ORF type:complete len:349 (+),score=80.81 TRINITY_DN3733_c0_g1_i1:18-1064(+)
MANKTCIFAVCTLIVIVLASLAIFIPILILGNIHKKPQRLQKGDTVGFISLASPVAYTKGYSNITVYKQHVESFMNAMGLNVMWGKNAFLEDKYFAGNATQRVQDLHDMISNKNVKWIISNRGGYGCNTLLDLIDYKLIKNNPKGIQGYSDITSCLQAISYETGLATFHGPMGIDDWTGTDNGKWFEKIVMNGELPTMKNNANFSTTIKITGGKAKGRSVGGNLSLIASLLGTRYFTAADFSGKILFLEDVNESPESIDRMMSNLKLGGYLDEIAGFVFGQCTSCSYNSSVSFSTFEVIERYTKDLGIPSFYGAQIGHISEQFLIPVDVNIEIDADLFTITLLEAAVL